MAKTHTSYEVKRRWALKNYKQVTATFRYDRDQEILDFIEKHKDKYGTTNIVRDALQMYIDSHVLDD